jgi:hypothetical protein
MMVPASLLNGDSTVRISPWLSSGNPDIFAVGDVSKIPSLILQDWFTGDNWSYARDMGTTAARNMLGQGELFTKAPAFSL